MVLLFDTLKMTTYEVICLKQYLHNPDLLPPAIRSKLSSLSHHN